MDQRTPDPSQPLGPGPQSRNTNPAVNYTFSPEEKKVLQECNSESFFQRCVPIGTTMGLGTYYAVRAGHLKANPRWGALPKVALAVTVGYFIGKFSYQQKCAEKFMKLPNSQIGEVLRQRRRGNLTESLEPGFGPSMSLAPFSSGISSSDTYSDVGPRSSLDIDTDRPQQRGLDDYKPNNESPIYEEEMPPQQKNITTYEELRKKNRDEYTSRRIGNYKSQAEASTDFRTPPVPPKRLQKSDEGFSDNRPSQTNKYGDAME